MHISKSVVTGMALAFLSTLNLQFSACYAAPGDMDPTFAGTGKLRLGFGGGPGFGRAAAVQSDGKLVIAGGTDLYGTNSEFAIVRFDTNNVLDASFGAEGRVHTAIGSQNYAVANAVRIQADGKIVAAGYAYEGTNNQPVFALARYDPDGSLDTSFGDDGKVITDFAPAWPFPHNSTINALAIQNDGKIVVAGSFYEAVNFNQLSEGFELARYDTNGVLDASFGTNGIVETTFANVVGGTGANGLIILPGGKIIAVGTASYSGVLAEYSDFVLAGYDANGAPDTTFGNGGSEVFYVGSPPSIFGGGASAQAVALQFGNNTILNPDKIVVAGEATLGTFQSGFVVARFFLDGLLDTNFGTGGIMTNLFDTSDPYSDSYGEGLVVQGQLFQPRKITVGGYTYDAGSNTYHFAMARLNADGSFDTTFGTNGTGRVLFSPTANSGAAYALTFQSGHFVLAGFAGNSNSQPDFAAARFNPDGSVDSSFGNRGVVTADTDRNAHAHGVAVQPDGKVVVAGDAEIGATTELALVRCNPDGSLDNTFGANGGKITIAVGHSNAVANAILLQPDGKIVAAGSSYNGTNNDFALVRFNSNGSLDTSFGGSGETITVVSGSNDVANALALQSDGKIVVAGYGFSGANQDFAVARYQTNGTLDASFGGTGIVMTGVGSGADQASAVRVQADGKIVVAGQARVGSDTNFALARYNPDGSLDNTFGTFGRVTTDFGSGTEDYGLALALQSDGKIIVAGGATIGGTEYVALVRYDTNGVPDSTFGSGGEVITQVGSTSDYAAALALQPGGQIVVAGVSQQGVNDEYAILRYNPDGSLDSSYGTGGKVLVSLENDGDLANAVALDQLDRAVVVGNANNLFGLARLLGDTLPGIALSISLPAFNTAKVSWPYPSTGWNLQENSDLSKTNWITPPETVNNDGTNKYILVNPPINNEFYRLFNTGN